MNNNIAVVGIMCRGNGCKCVIYAYLIVINISIGNKLYYGDRG